MTWFATDGGLARYDGRRTNAINAEGLPPGRVLALKADNSGALWIGTDNGATRLANGRFDPVKETAGKVITAIITPQTDRAIMASESGAIFDCQVSKPTEPSSPSRAGEGTPGLTIVTRTIPAQPLQSADVDHPGPLKITSLALVDQKLFAGTQSRGILLIENGEAKDVSSKPRSYFINALETDGQGRLWVGARARSEDSGLLDNTEPLKPSKTAAMTGPVMAIGRGAHDDIWVGTDGRGAFHFQAGKQIEHFTFEGTGGALRSDHIFGVFVDAEEVIWFATDKGVCRYDPHAARAENISDDPSTNYVRALWRTSRGHLLAGTNAGLFAYEATNKSWRAIPELGRRIIYALNEDRNGRVLVATANGLFGSSSGAAAQQLSFARIGPEERPPPGDSVRAVATAGGATYIATFGYGVEKLQGAQRSLVWPAPSAEDRLREVISLNADSGGRLLIGTTNDGLFFFDGKQTTTENALERIRGDAIWSVAAEGSGLWLATGRGLYLYESDQLKEIAPGISARDLFITAADNAQIGRVWCATVGNGLLRVARDQQFGSIVSRLDVEQGLPSQRVFAVLSERAADGSESVIAGTNRGVVRYEPGRIAPTVLPARIISQRIHQPQELSTGLQLDFPQNSLLLDVTAISSRTFPEQFQYAFTLYDKSGKIIREKLSHDSQFAMEKLKPGKYKVIARAFTKDLVASVPLSFEFNVAGAPFPWTSTALAVLLALALMALLWAILERRRIVRTSAALAAANRELAGARLDLANEAERERRRIARDLHDQTLADLRHLMLLTDQLPTSSGTGTPPALRTEIESISQEVRRICEDLSPSALENVGLGAALQFALTHAAEGAPADVRVRYEFDSDDALDEKLKLPASAQIQIYRIAQEALSNVTRHAQADHVKMRVTATNTGSFTLEIADNGRGFDTNDTNKESNRGVANIRARASMINAEPRWRRRDEGGTVFTLSKPSSEAGETPGYATRKDPDAGPASR